MTMAGQPAQSSAPAVELVVSEATSTDNDFTPRPPVALANADDAEEHAAAVRDEAIRFATIAAARALRTALAHDAAALTRYVDDALRACGRVVHSRVRLHPADAALYRPRRDVEIVADASAARGDVSVETDAGTVGATIEDRAALLVRAAAHA
jgi:flagellar biosynthesis/type III secretory pathway protein FliH